MTEIKSLQNPPAVVKQVIVSFADFIEGRLDSDYHQAKSKLLEFIKRGVGEKEPVDELRLSVLRQFAAAEISLEEVKKKSHAAAFFANYLVEMKRLQEHLAILKEDEQGIPEVANVETIGAVGKDA